MLIKQHARKFLTYKWKDDQTECPNLSLELEFPQSNSSLNFHPEMCLMMVP